ncbi:MAG: MaoC family dehydratase N-terminal domain-containing protein [Chloroflexi bacterium]|nr:MaoC family dehydratase N-terminal domain-containing protein [Chloroflexota bacterium]
MAQESSILAELKKMVGREMVITGPEEVGRAAIRYFAQAIGDMNPLYLDEEYARGTSDGGIIKANITSITFDGSAVRGSVSSSTVREGYRGFYLNGADNISLTRRSSASLAWRRVVSSLLRA